MINSTLVRLYFLEGIGGGVPLDSHVFRYVFGDPVGKDSMIPGTLHSQPVLNGSMEMVISNHFSMVSIWIEKSN